MAFLGCLLSGPAVCQSSELPSTLCPHRARVLLRDQRWVSCRSIVVGQWQEVRSQRCSTGHTRLRVIRRQMVWLVLFPLVTSQCSQACFQLLGQYINIQVAKAEH